MRPAAVTFDLNGTLIHSPRLGEIYAEVLGRHDIRADSGETLAAIRVVWQEFECRSRLGEDRYSSHPEGARGWWGEFIRRVCVHLDVEGPSRFAQAELFDRFAHAEAWEIYPDVPEGLDRLGSLGLRLAVISNWDERLPTLLEHLDLAEHFDVVVSSSQVGLEKPHPRIFEFALENLEVAPEEAIHIGDRRRIDVEGAEAIGMGAAWIDRRGRAGGPTELIGLLESVGIFSSGRRQR